MIEARIPTPIDSVPDDYPTAIESERVILGTIAIDPNTFAGVREHISHQDFALTSHQQIFRAMEHLAGQDQPFDQIVLCQELTRRKQIEAVGGWAYVSDLPTGIPRGLVLDRHIRAVKNKAVLRSLIQIADATTARARDQVETGLEIAAWADSAIETLIETGMGVTEAECDAAAATVSALEEFDRRRQLEHDDALPYGMMDELDKLTGGMFAGEVTVIGGESGVGKSSAMIQALMWAGKHNEPAVCYSLEMTRAQLLGRMWSILSGVPYRFVRFPRSANMEQTEALRKAAYSIAEWPLHIYDRASMSLGEILASCRVHIQRRRAKLVCLDYIQRILVPGNKDVRLQMAEAAMHLAMVVKGTPAHLILLSQLKRREDNGYPQMKDLRESGQIENEAHCIALLWREYDKDRGHHLTNGKVIIPKNRFGFNGMCDATFNVNTAIFE